MKFIAAHFTSFAKLILICVYMQALRNQNVQCLSVTSSVSYQSPQVRSKDKINVTNVASNQEMKLHYSTLQKQLQCDIKGTNARFDCFPDLPTSAKQCDQRGCCWNPQQNTFANKKKRDYSKPYNVPWCYYPKNYIGYKLVKIQETDYGYSGTLTRNTPSGWPNDIKHLQLDVYYETKNRLHFKIFDPNHRRFEVPLSTPKVTTKASETDYDVKFTHSPFGITVFRKKTGETLFNSALDSAPLTFADQFIEISSHTGTGLVYGLGEHKAPLLHNATWSHLAFWARDNGTPLDSNLYGTHPFYLSLEENGNAHGVFLLNSNAMEVLLQPLPALTFRTIGGILDFYIFTGPSSDLVIQQYTDVIGKPFMPPYWALGFHLCRYGLHSSQMLKDIIARNRAIKIPYEVQWNDIDYMQDYLDWTYDRKKYAGLPEIVKDLHDNDQKYVIIVDPGISNQHPGNYTPYDEGMKDDIFIKNATGQPLEGAVWPGPTLFPDWTNPKTKDWWYRQANAYYKQVPFDGLWTDMNEPSNFMYGSTHGCTSGKLDEPPYVPGIVGSGQLPDRTLCASARQYLSTHYDLHNLYGHTETIATNYALKKILKKRSIVITRSSYAGTGQFAGHWSGDNTATWEDLYYSIPLMLNFQMYGIPFVGADICGFGGDTTEELCIRWMQVGAFYPFSRNHNDLHSKDQDPAVWSYKAQQIMKDVLEIRYALLPYLYTLLHKSHMTGAPVVRPLFFQFPTDRATYAIDTQFLWGDGLLISPALKKNQTTVEAYFPKGRWYSVGLGSCIVSTGKTVTLDTPLEVINLHVRGGAILPVQMPALTTVKARKQAFNLVIALNESLAAYGDLFWDDGETLDTAERGSYTWIEFSASKGEVISSPIHRSYKPASGMTLSAVRILGVPHEPHSVTLNGAAIEFFYSKQRELDVGDFSADLLSPIKITWK